MKQHCMIVVCIGLIASNVLVRCNVEHRQKKINEVTSLENGLFNDNEQDRDLLDQESAGEKVISCGKTILAFGAAALYLVITGAYVHLLLPHPFFLHGK